jgi:sulfite exporter TauE/SafE
LLPCGLLQSALVMAALGNSALAGASVMAAFALASSPGLMAAPWLFRALGRFGGGGDAQRRLLTRLSGLLLAAASGWALTHGLWARFLAWCFE